MRRAITYLLVLVIASMLAGTALADCAAMNMPCCPQHRNTTCREACAAPAGNISSAAMPEFTGEMAAIVPAAPICPAPQLALSSLFAGAVPSSERLLARIHVLLI